jgi:hypothetical protein
VKRLALGVAALAAAPGCAQPPPARTGHPRVDAFIADLAAGRREAALAKVHGMESASGEPNVVATPAQFVDKLLQCSYLSVRRPTIGPPMYDITWRCPDGDYRSLIDPDWRPPRLTVGQFETMAAIEERRRNPRVPPPLTLPSRSAER